MTQLLAVIKEGGTACAADMLMPPCHARKYPLTRCTYLAAIHSRYSKRARARIRKHGKSRALFVQKNRGANEKHLAVIRGNCHQHPIGTLAYRMRVSFSGCTLRTWSVYGCLKHACVFAIVYPY